MRYKGALQKILSTELFLMGLPVLFLEERRKILKYYCIKSVTKTIHLAMYIITLFFFNQLVTFATV